MNMKLAILFLSLALVACTVFAEELQSEIDEDVDLGTAGGDKLGEFRKRFGTGDLLEDGNGKYNEGRKSLCPQARNAKDCQLCCSALDKADKFRPLKFEGAHLGKCICFDKPTL